MKISDKIHGFTVKEAHEISGLGATLYVMKHEKSGARLVYLDREDENKTFAVSFKTLPTDSTGVFHILEHSVLCGSEKYRLKDPFVELLSGSLNTFLNAMTFSDKTMYPVASTSEKEFLNLADVYLDAVFNPLAVKSELAFMQEGWHYEVDEAGELSYKGVVLNEMRGDYSSPESVADRHIKDMLFAGTCYAHDSGGDPSEITSLDYSEFCEAHATYYHPSNATFFLDGTMDVSAALALISGYIDGYDAIDTSGEKFVFKNAKRTKAFREVEFEIPENESKENKGRLAVAHLTFRFDEREKIFGAAILASALLSTNESEIKKAILSSKLCEDLQINVGEGIYENYFEVDFINVKDGKAEELRAFFYDTVREVAKRGIDRAELAAAANSLEFSLRERDYGTIPLGIVYAMNLMESYLYSENAVSGLSFENELKFIRENIEGDFFEKLLLEMFIENESAITLLMHPSSDIGERQRAEEEKKLSDKKAALKPYELEDLKRKCEELMLWQNTEESEEEKSSIPRLKASDLSDEVRTIPLTASAFGGAELLSIPIATNGISYAELYFDASDLSEDEIFTAALLGLFLGNLATEKYGAAELIRTIKSEIGSLSTALKPMTSTDGSLKVYFKAFVSSLSSKKDKAAELILEVLTKTRFEDADAMESIIKQAYIASEESFSQAGHRAAKSRASAMMFSEAAVQEYYSGYEAHKKYKELSKNFAAQLPLIKEKLTAFIGKYFSSERLTVALADDGADGSDAFMNSLADSFNGGEQPYRPSCSIEPLPKRREGIRVPAKVGFSSLVLDTKPEKPSELGIAMVASNLVSYEYLWSEIRVKGGAYGAGMGALRTGQTSFYSYRDPSPKNSVEKMKVAPDYILSAVEGEANIEKYIIGAIGDTSPYLTPRARASIGAQRHLLSLTDDMRRETRREILGANSEKLAAYARRLAEVVDSGAYCIVAPTDKLDAENLDEVLEI